MNMLLERTLLNRPHRQKNPMNPPVNLWPNFSGDDSQLAFYISLAVAMLMHGGDIGMSRASLLSYLPKHVPSLAYYYEQARQSGSRTIKWLSRSNARLLWKALSADPCIGRRGWGTRAVFFFKGIHGRFDTPAALCFYLDSQAQSGRCGVDRLSIEGSATVYTVKEGNKTSTFNSFKGLARRIAMAPHEACILFASSLSDRTNNFLYEGKMISWKASIDTHIQTLVHQGRCEVLQRSDGSRIIVSCRHARPSATIGRSTSV